MVRAGVRPRCPRPTRGVHSRARCAEELRGVIRESSIVAAWVVVSWSVPLRAQDAAQPKPTFVDGQAQIVEAFKDKSRWISHDLWVETSFDSDGDGAPDRVHVDVTRPEQTESAGLKLAVVYESSPYFSGIGSTDSKYFWSPVQELGRAPTPRTPMPAVGFESKRPLMSRDLIDTWVPRGFAVVHSASPGTGLSDGCPTVGGSNESLAPKAVIDWLNGRAKGFSAPTGGDPVLAYWSTGKVAMTGTSYNGTLSLAAATTGVEGLMVVVPDAPNTSYYHYYRSNGLVRHPGGYTGEDVDVLYDFINSGDPERRAWCNEHVRDELLAASADRQSGDFNAFWKSRDYALALANVKCAVLLSHGLSDWNVMPEHSIRIFEGLKANGLAPSLHLHQGGHGGPPPLAMMNRWFSHYLYGVDNGVEKDPRLWVVREDGKRGQPTPYADYPNPEARAVVLHLEKGGEKCGVLTLKARKGQGRESLVDDVAQGGAALAQAERSEHRLLYSTAPLEAPLHLSGTPRVTLRLSCDRPAANLSVWLVTLPWTQERRSESNVITRGWADPQNHASLERGEPLEKGKFYEVRFALQPDDQIVPAGKSLALMVFSSDRDFTLWPAAGTKLTFDLDASALELPVVGGEAALEAALGR
ncbi:MAG: Xaa-Pro dipeptidyl-peptidase [Planctomycetes bacterium]|nr:Xaa-Pro dipeptidyl-peptidase [Planctomycetota bacterium]